MIDWNPEMYDAWYDSHREIFQKEIRCLSFPKRDPSIEIGVGTGRFAHSLRYRLGIDPSMEMLKIARRRGIETILGVAEFLPFKDSSIGTILMAATLCFVDAKKAIDEAFRVLRPDGELHLGVIYADTLLGREYIKKGREGHPIYSRARFQKRAELHDLLAHGFVVIEERSAGLEPPDFHCIRARKRHFNRRHP